MRPLGAIVLAAYADQHGRRAGLLLTLGLMFLGILTIACVPGYASIGLLAPLLVLIGRLLQGFSAGMQLGSVSVYLAEIAPADHKGCAHPHDPTGRFRARGLSLVVPGRRLLARPIDSVAPAR